MVVPKTSHKVGKCGCKPPSGEFGSLGNFIDSFRPDEPFLAGNLILPALAHSQGAGCPYF